jgi:hypothetical protein
MKRLHVIWRGTTGSSKCLIGELWETRDGYAFAYSPEVAEARKRGFSLLTEFPEERGKERPYVASYLFPTFAQRVPTPKRSDFADLLASWGVEQPDSKLEILARSGGFQLTDRIELAEWRAEDDDLSRPLEFRVAGMRYYLGAGSVREGDALDLQRDVGNEHDDFATFVVLRDGEKLGHVPRQYSKMLTALLESSTRLTAQAVRRLVAPAKEDNGRWVVRVSRLDGLGLRAAS